MSLRSGLVKRWEIILELARMIRDRRAYILIPLLLAVAFILVFMLAGEMPILIPFFYAVF